LSDSDWDEFMCNNTELSWIKLKESLSNLITRYVPIKRITANRKFKKPISMTYKVAKLIGKKRRLFHKYKDKSHPAV